MRSHACPRGAGLHRSTSSIFFKNTPSADATAPTTLAMRFLDGAGSLATLHVQVELPPASVLIDLAIVTVASMVFGGAVGVVTFALEKLRPRAPRAVSLLLAALSLLAASFPFRLNRQIRPHFMVFFATASHGVVIFFKTIEVLCQTRPAGLERSLKPWVVYFACDAEMKFARPAAAAADVAAKAKQSAGPLPSPPLLRVFPRLFIRAIVFLAANSLLLHVGALYAWRPFRPRLGAVGAVLDVYFYACLLWSCAEWVIALARMAVHVCGYDSIPAFRLPLLQSASPREFWGKRWNLIIHKLMHRTYFEPVTARARAAPGRPTQGRAGAAGSTGSRGAPGTPRHARRCCPSPSAGSLLLPPRRSPDRRARPPSARSPPSSRAPCSTSTCTRAACPGVGAAVRLCVYARSLRRA